MVRKLRVAAVGICAILVLAVSASGASAKGGLNLKEEGASKPVPAGSTVPAGWYIGIGESYYCQIVQLAENEEIVEGSMTLRTNGESKDKATGSVTAPPCYEVEEEGEGAAAPAVVSHKHHHRGGLRKRVFATSETAITVTGTLASQEVTTKKTGTIELSKPLVVTLETGATTCIYESKTKLKGTWPPEASPEFPNITKTADLDSEIALKLSKASTPKACAKSEEAFVETWLGPLGEEFEAELFS